MAKPQILLTNDDGIRSPGLWAAAESLSLLGFVTVAAPREQSSGMGRSLPNTSDGVIQTEIMRVNGKEWTVYAVSGSPAQAVLHGIMEIMQKPPDLVVSGINYGENVGTGITVSGTVGAALEAASQGIPALAMSLETDQVHHLSYSTKVDFSTASFFTAFFARQLLEKHFPADVDLLKVDVPSDATQKTHWRLTHLAHQQYYVPVPPRRITWEKPGKIDYKEAAILERESEESDVFVLRSKRMISVTPLSLDLTSRVDFKELNRLLSTGVDNLNIS
jgi:5'-nucleotidase